MLIVKPYRNNAVLQLKKLKHEKIYCSITNGGNDQFAQSKEGRSRTPQRANMEKMTPQNVPKNRLKR
jgi:hypothetical protein